jgi:HemY protein
LQGPIEEGSANTVDEAIRTLPPIAIETRPAVKAEKAETVKAEPPVVVTAVAEPVPAKAETPQKADAVPAGSEEEERPFYGLPDDPGVKAGAVRRDDTSSFKLF